MADGEGLMSFDDLVARLKSQCIVEFSRIRADQGMQVHLSIKFKDINVAVVPVDDNLLYLCERHILAEVRPAALQEAFRQIIAECAKNEWGIDFS